MQKDSQTVNKAFSLVLYTRLLSNESITENSKTVKRNNAENKMEMVKQLASKQTNGKWHWQHFLMSTVP